MQAYQPHIDIGSPDSDIVEGAREVLDRYYESEIQDVVVGNSPTNQICVEIGDIELFATEKAAKKAAEDPDRYEVLFTKALGKTDACRGSNPNAYVKLVDSTDRFVQDYGVGEINSNHVKTYVRVSGQLSATTKVRSFPQVATFICNECGMGTDVPQDTRELTEPSDPCCEKRNYQIDYAESQWVDHRKLKIQQPPEDATNGESQYLAVHVFDDECNDKFGQPLSERVGQDCSVYGIVELRQLDGRGADEFLFEHYMRGLHVEFNESGAQAVDVEKHKERVQELAQREDVYELFSRSIAPQIHPTRQMSLAMDVCAAYLFAAPRVDPRNGAMYRGDIHAALIGDPGMAKSVLLKGVADFSPDCEHRSATGLSSDVGLVAAAVEDDFDGGWTLKPGILVRAGMHAVIDEIDKGPDKLEKINDALEGRQIASIDKAGMKADLKTRTGLLCSGNPEGSRFSAHEPLPDQIDVDESLLTRFDCIVLLIDRPDEEQDAKIADHITQSYRESVEMMKDESVEADHTKREVSPEVGKAWVMMGRDIVPTLPEGMTDMLKDFYVEARSKNGDEETISATARQLEAGIRLSSAFARMRLSETIEACDVEKAISVSRALIGQTFDADTGTFDIDQLTASKSTKTQKSRIDTIEEVLSKSETKTPATIAEETGIDEDVVYDQLETMATKGNVIRPKTGEYRKT